jgi:hypothetical protein
MLRLTLFCTILLLIIFVINHASALDDAFFHFKPDRKNPKLHNPSSFTCEKNGFAALTPEQRVICENNLPGSPSSEWDVNGHGDPTIQGFSVDISYNVGSTAFFKIRTSDDTESYKVDIYRTGYYNGLGARLVATVYPNISDFSSFRQPDCNLDPETYEYSCRAWAITAIWDIPSDAASGVYIARPTRTDNKPHKTWRADNSQAGVDARFAMPGSKDDVPPAPGPQKYGANGLGKLRNPMREPRASHIYFVVRDDSSRADIVFQTADTVWQAYNPEGGANMYYSFSPDIKHRCYKASYDRPTRTREIRPANCFLGSEFPMIQFLEQYGYSITYISGVDTDRLGSKRLNQHKLFLSVGHDEYWSGVQRANLEAAIDNGLHVAFLSGNELFWRIRWEDNYRTMVVYKESQEIVKTDPNQTEWTGTWRDSRDINPVGGKPENAVIGNLFTMNAWRNDPLIVPRRFAKLRWWKNTEVADLANENSKKEFVAYLRGVLGHEMDEDVDNGFRPPGVIHLSHTDVDNVMYSISYGADYDSGHGVHRLTLYKNRKSGAIIFGAGTCQWSWGLANFHDSESGIPAPSVNHLNTRVGTDVLSPVKDLQQLTVTIFNEMRRDPVNEKEGIRPFYYVPLEDFETNTPRWYRQSVASGKSFQLLKDLPRDITTPSCKIVDVSYQNTNKRIFADGFHPERVATIRVAATDVDGVVSGVEVSVSHLTSYREGTWHFALPEGDVTGDPLSGDESIWSTQIPVLRDLFNLDVKNKADQQETISEDEIVALVLKHAKCRATDDSLNTNFLGQQETKNNGGGDL